MFPIHLDDMLDLAVQHQAEIRANFEREARASSGRADRRSWRLPSLKGIWSAIALQIAPQHISDDVLWPRLKDYPYRR
jgi:hypothetical protein